MSSTPLSVLVLAVALLPAWGPAHARDLGVIGPLYEIAEPGMLEEIHARLLAKQASGELAQFQDEARRRILARIDVPLPVPGLHRTAQPRSYVFDPSVRFDENVVDSQGRVIIPAGMQANPLSVVSLPATLLFFDGRDPDQVAAIRKEVEASSAPVTPILVAGSPTALARLWKRPVYFDQGGQMVQRFGISAVPARVTQDGPYLRVQEFVAQ